MRNLESISGGQVTSANAVDQIERLQAGVETVIKGKPEAIRLFQLAARLDPNYARLLAGGLGPATQPPRGIE